MTEIALGLLLVLLPVLYYLTSRVRAGKSGELRTLPGLEDISASVGRSAETGQPLHVSVGVGGVGGSVTADTWAGLTVLAKLADAAAACDTPLIVTVSDPTVLPLAEDTLRRAYARHGNLQDFDPNQVRFVAADPMAYAAGVSGMFGRESLTSNVTIGTFGDEYLLMGEAGVRHGVHQVAGTSDPRTLPFMYATADDTLVGEEIFAGGAYTSRLPSQIASLLTQDWARWVVIAAILIAAVYKFLL